MPWHVVSIEFNDYRRIIQHNPNPVSVIDYLKNKVPDIGIKTKVSLCRIMLAPYYAQKQIDWCTNNIEKDCWQWDVDDCEDFNVGDSMLYFSFAREQDAIHFKLTFG